MKTFSLHKINDHMHPPFSLSDYSQFKYGSNRIAEQFGTEMAEKFFNWYADLEIGMNWADRFDRKQLVIFCSPYNYATPAVALLQKYFVQKLNRLLTSSGYSPVQTAKAFRSISYTQDYGALNKEERLNLISKEVIHIDTNFCRGKHLVFMDDVKITGSHEKVMVDMLHRYDMQEEEITFAYFAELTNPEVPAHFEDYINHRWVQRLDHLRFLMTDEKGHTLNMRVLKFLMKAEPTELATFLNYIPAHVVEQIYDYALGEGYHKNEFAGNTLVIGYHLMSLRPQSLIKN